MYRLFVAFLVVLCANMAVMTTEFRTGCLQLGHTRKIQIPDCVEFNITTNACRGFCESFAVPSFFAMHKPVMNQPVTSVG